MRRYAKPKPGLAGEPGRPLRVLVIEDSEDDALLIIRRLRAGGYDPRWERVETEEGMTTALAKPWDIVISDYVMPQFSGLAALDCLKSSGQDVPFIIVSGSIGEDIAVDVMRAGADDYVMKDNPRRLVPAVERELREAQSRRARKAAQDELDAAQALLEKVFSITQVMVASMDAQFRFLRVNPAYANAYGREPQAFLGKSYFDVVPERSDEAGFRSVLETGKPLFDHAVPLAAYGDRGRPIFVNRSIHRLAESDGRVSGIILVLFDVTREVLLDQRARQAQKMEALGTLAGGIAHDFNNILAAIVLNAELALGDETDPGAPARYLPLVLQAAERGKDLVKQVLAFSRKKDREAKPINVAPALREALRFLRASLPPTIEISHHISEDAGVILADKTEIHQILMNLAGNAAHAMREAGGVLTIALEPVDLDEEAASQIPDLKPGPYVRLSVEDTGTGIPADVLPRIFDPFFTTKGQAEGTGLGLPVVHGIVASCGGAISVSSAIGKGTAFEVFFPRLSGEGIPVRVRTDPIPTGHERVLVVDDELIQAEGLHDMLERLGYDVIFETDSAKAIDRFRADPKAFDIIVTDQAMPHLPGSKLAEEATAIRGDLPVVLCTGFGDGIAGAGKVLPGIREMVMKPYTIREMAAAIRRALDGRP